MMPQHALRKLEEIIKDSNADQDAAEGYLMVLWHAVLNGPEVGA